MKKSILISVLSILNVFAGAASATDWTLLADESRISFVSVKAETIGEVHHFTNIEGSVNAAGDVIIQLPLESVETGIDIRNERMREFLFETVNFPAAIITAKINPADYKDEAAGNRTSVTLTALLDLHGITSELEFEAFVTRVADNKIAVDTLSPILVDADEFDLGTGLDKLKELAGLDMISPIVPVTISLMFER